MKPAPAFRVTFWGATGSFPRPKTPRELADGFRATLRDLARDGAGWESLGRAAADEVAFERLLCERTAWPSRDAFGGNTTCIEIRAGDQLIVVDAGSGIRELGNAMARASESPAPFRGQLLLTHAHLDHVCGLPFFEPVFDPHNEFTLRAPQRVLDAVRGILDPRAPLAGTFLPQTLDRMPGLRACENIEAGDRIDYGDVHVSTMALHHPGGCLAYRFDRLGKAVVIATDHEHTATPDEALAQFAAGADLLYLDAQYLRDEYDGRVGVASEPALKRVGWGHSCMEACLPTALAAGVRSLHLGHHEPKRSDAELAKIERQAQTLLDELLRQPEHAGRSCEVQLTREGQVVEVE